MSATNSASHEQDLRAWVECVEITEAAFDRFDVESAWQRVSALGAGGALLMEAARSAFFRTHTGGWRVFYACEEPRDATVAADEDGTVLVATRVGGDLLPNDQNLVDLLGCETADRELLLAGARALVSTAEQRTESLRDRARRKVGLAPLRVVPEKPVFDPDLIPDVGRITRSPENEAIDRTLATIGILEAYEKWCPKRPMPKVGNKTESIMVRCPNPAHEDKKPSAWVNTDKNAGNCAVCGGFDKFDIAAWGLGFDVPGYKSKEKFPELRRAMARDLGHRSPEELLTQAWVPIAKPLVPAISSIEGGEEATGGDAVGIAAQVGSPASSAIGRRGLTHFIHGDEFIARSAIDVPTLWGEDEVNLWGPGEPLYFVGGPGLGKTTLVLNLIRARLGIGSAIVLGCPVAADDRPVLYFALDRPRQIGRLLGLIVSNPAERGELHDRLLVVTQREVPLDVNRNPAQLLELAQEAGAGTVVVDSVKDAVMKPSDEEMAGALNRAGQLLIANDVEVVFNHHPRKGSGGTPTLDDVYGSMLFGAGGGSVLMLGGRPGGKITLLQVKSPNGEYDRRVYEVVNPGVLRLCGRDATPKDKSDDLTDWIASRGTTGVSAQEASDRLGVSTETARKQLEKLAHVGALNKDAGVAGGAGGGRRSRYSVPPPVIGLADVS